MVTVTTMTPQRALPAPVPGDDPGAATGPGSFPVSLPAAVAAGVFLVAAAVSLLHLAGLSASVSPDTLGYFRTLGSILRADRGDYCLRTPGYSILIAVADLFAHSGYGVLAVQIASRAFSCALLALVICRISPGAGLLVGTLLALDPAGATNSVGYMTESLYASAQVLTLALLVAHWRKPARLGPRTLFLTGLLLGAALMIRPTGWLFLPPLLAAYAWMLRSWLKPLALAAGFSAVILGIVLFNGVRTGYYGLARSGLYLAFPLFVQQLFSPDNGPGSRELDRLLKECHPALDYRGISVDNSNDVVHRVFAECIEKAYPDGPVPAWDLFRIAYREAALARPWLFARRITREALYFLYGPATDYVYQTAASSASFDRRAFCAAEGSKRDAPAREFFCPLPAPSPRIRSLLARLAVRAVPLYQPYLALGHLVRSAFMAALLACGYLLAATLLSVPGLRLPVILSGLLIGGNALLTAVGQLTLSRYTSVVGPFYLVIAGVALHSAVVRGGAAARLLAGRFRATAGTGA
jgi:hypothetical protein